MGQKERGIAPPPPETAVAGSATTPATARIAPAASSSSPALTRSNTNSSASAPGAPASSSGVGDANGRGAVYGGGWAMSIRHLLWEKWRWGVVLALAVIVSRLSSST